MANQFFRPLAGWVIRYRQQIIQFGWPLVAFESFTWIYDHVFFPTAIGFWGAVWGAVISVAGAFILNAFVFWLYDHLKIDWLQARFVRELADKENKTRLEKLLTWHRKERRTIGQKIVGVLGFIALTLPLDPVIVAVYYRKDYFNGISLRDWMVLLAATLSACLFWLVIWEILVGGGKMAFHFVSHLHLLA